MDYKKIVTMIDAFGIDSDTLVRLASMFEDYGTDELLITCPSFDDKEKEEFLENIKKVTRKIDTPVIIGVRVKRFEDIKKAFYTGARDVLLLKEDTEGTTLLKEGTDRFGEEHVYEQDKIPVFEEASAVAIAHAFKNGAERAAVSYLAFGNDSLAIVNLKNEIREQGVEVNTFASSIAFSELKTDANGLIPCIVQDYRTLEVLMMAYMDEEAFNETVRTGLMTFHSRSRNELWVKGMTSGNLQFLKSLSADCDKDTLIAKVHPQGPACHTGAVSCFFNNMVQHEYDDKNVYKVLQKLYDVVTDRKANPKEGSYTNYLFDKGIDKILKKCGEEATEIVIAAKNPNPEEIKYEIADFLYHLTVLMVECGVDWDDVAGELANR